MAYFELPKATKIERVIPKNSFYKYTNSKQKRVFVDDVLRITWLNKLSKATINLTSEEVEEIQLFKIELKIGSKAKDIMDIIDKAIPYSIIFILEYDEEYAISLAIKHSHQIDEDNAVIDWRFTSEWHNTDRFRLNLVESLDSVIKDLSSQISGIPNSSELSPAELILKQQDKNKLTKEIIKLEAQIRRCKQFNQKVELNQQLRKLKQ